MALFYYVYERPARKHFRWWHNWAVRSRLKPMIGPRAPALEGRTLPVGHWSGPTCRRQFGGRLTHSPMRIPVARVSKRALRGRRFGAIPPARVGPPRVR